MAMKRTTAVLAAALLLIAVGAALAQEGAKSDWLETLAERETLSGDWFGFGEALAEKGLTVGLGATQVYQVNARGGLSTHRRAGRCAGSYDLELEVDFEKFVDLRGGSMFLLAEGSWSEGIDEPSVGSLFGVNADAGGDQTAALTQCWYEQALLDCLLRVRLGKISLTGGFECRGCPAAFDGNAFANDETGQFLNGALVNNPTIPFPDNGLGVAAYIQPLEWMYLAAGVADADADARETERL